MTRLLEAPLVLRLAGPVTLTRADGLVVTPRAAKLQALLVLLATGQNMSRPRAFLQDKLWSEAQPAKGAASLRQALSSLRRELGPDALLATQNLAGLNPERLKVDLRYDGALGETQEFASGLDVQDGEFEDWLRDRRQEYDRLLQKHAPGSDQPSKSRPVLVSLPPVCSDDALRAATEILTSDIAANVSRTGDAVVQLDVSGGVTGDKLALQVRAARVSTSARYQVQLINVVNRQIVWTGACNSTANGPFSEPDIFDDLIARASFAAIRHFGRFNEEGSFTSERLPYQMYAHFPFQNSPETAAFDRWLSALQDPQSTALHLAWRARLRVVAMLEILWFSRLRAKSLCNCKPSQTWRRNLLPIVSRWIPIVPLPRRSMVKRWCGVVARKRVWRPRNARCVCRLGCRTEAGGMSDALPRR